MQTMPCQTRNPVDRLVTQTGSDLLRVCLGIYLPIFCFFLCVSVPNFAYSSIWNGYDGIFLHITVFTTPLDIKLKGVMALYWST